MGRFVGGSFRGALGGSLLTPANPCQPKSIICQNQNNIIFTFEVFVCVLFIVVFADSLLISRILCRSNSKSQVQGTMSCQEMATRCQTRCAFVRRTYQFASFCKLSIFYKVSLLSPSVHLPCPKSRHKCCPKYRPKCLPRVVQSVHQMSTQMSAQSATKMSAKVAESVCQTVCPKRPPKCPAKVSTKVSAQSVVRSEFSMLFPARPRCAHTMERQ